MTSSDESPSLYVGAAAEPALPQEMVALPGQKVRRSR